MLRRLALIAPLLVVSHAAFAQETARDTVRRVPVVVTATRTKLTRDRVPQSVSVLTGEQLRAQGITTVADALRQVPGVSLAQAASYGSATSLFIRGGESKFTKVLLDGVPVNDAGGAFDFSSLTTDNVERIEIVRGPASVLYGSDAVAGVVQVFTRHGTRGVHADLTARGGDFRTRDVEASVRGAVTPGRSVIDWSLGAARHRTDGYQAFNSAHADNTASALLRASYGRADGQLSLRYGDIALHFPTDGSGQVVDSNAIHRDDRLAVGLGAGIRASDHVALRAMLASNDVHGVTDDQPDSPGDDEGYYYSTSDRTRRRSGDMRLELVLPRGSQLAVGGQIEREWQASATTSNYGPSGFTAARRTSGMYTQLLLEPSARYTATLGGRYEHNERFGDFWTWRAAASARVAAGTRLRASAGTAFREPTFLENFGSDFVIGNPSLAPEQSFSMDAAVEQQFGGVQLGATWFASAFRNLIDYVYSQTEPSYVNLARTRTSGVELEGRAELPAGLRADASFTWLDARVVRPGANTDLAATFAPGARLLRRPMHTFDAGAGYRDAWFGLDLRARLVGRRDDVFFAPNFTSSRVSLPSYTRIDVSGDVTLHGAGRGIVKSALTLRVDNLLDARYTEIAGVNYDFGRIDEQSLRLTGYRASPRRVLVGLRLTY